MRSESLEVKLTSLTRQEEAVKAAVQAWPAEAGKPVAVRLLDKAGREYRCATIVAHPDDDRVRWDLDFTVPERAELAKVQVWIPKRLREKRVPFEFRDVRIR